MLNLTKITLFILFIALIAGNIYVFINSIQLSDQINKFEVQISQLHKENQLLENKIYDVNSLKFAASMAAQLNFSQKAQPMFLDNLQYARN